MKGSSDLCGMVQAIAAIVQNQGQHDFPGCSTDDDVRSVCLCGITVYVENGYVVRLKAHDIDLVLNSYFHRTANVVPAHNSYAHYTFTKGDIPELSGWLDRLNSFQTVFCRAPAQEQQIA